MKFENKEELKKYLLSEFEKSGFEAATIETSKGDFVIEPFGFSDGEMTEKNIEHYFVYGSVPWLGADTLDDVVDGLYDIEAKAEEYEADKVELREFFEKNVKPVSDEDWKLSRKITDYNFDDMKSGESYTDTVERNKEVLMKKFGIDSETYDRLDKAQSDFNLYSDWHKDIYGFRPRGSEPGEYVPPYETVDLDALALEVQELADDRGLYSDSFFEELDQEWE